MLIYLIGFLLLLFSNLLYKFLLLTCATKQKCSTEIVQNSRKTKRSINNFVTKVRPATGIGRSYVCVFYNIKHSTDYVYIPYISKYIYIIEEKKCVQLGKVEGEEEGRNY